MSTRTWWLTGLAGLLVLAIAAPQAQRGAPSAIEKLTPLTTPVVKADPVVNFALPGARGRGAA